MPRSPHGLGNLSQLARFIREHARSGGEIIFTAHARREMASDKLNAIDVRSALNGCTVVRREMHGLDWRATCQGRTRLGETIEVVVKVIDVEAVAPRSGAGTESKLLVITVYKRTGR